MRAKSYSVTLPSLNLCSLHEAFERVRRIGTIVDGRFYHSPLIPLEVFFTTAFTVHVRHQYVSDLTIFRDISP